ncbi:hypothetical protein BJX96DRAFT_171992 [Aspergillus floccosus]
MISSTESNGSSPGWTTIESDEYRLDPPSGHDDEWPCDAPPPMAIVGMGVRLPGGVRSPDDFWQLMVEKRCASAPIPPGRYNVDAFHGVPGVDTQSVVAKNGYFLDEDYLCKVDSSFFNHNKYEQCAQDPQQRLLLEVVWECMESGGQVDWRGKDIGCFVGTFGEDWLDLTAKDTQKLDPLHVVGTGDYAVSNRVSYEYDLKGPSITCRTACSSSLVALHEACQAIALGDCASAIVGGTNLIFTPTMTTNMSQAGALSPEGKCKTFDASADGYTRAEGICALYIKKLDDAVRDKDPIRGVIRAVATNFDGRTNHITVPSAKGQEELIRKTYRKAHIHDLGETAFVECHGTATRVGDVVETTAVVNAFGKNGIIIGGVKPNIGHTEGAAGLAGLIKAVLALEHKQIPPNINFNTPNPAIMFEEGKLQVPVDTLPWPKGRKERVSVNCFGVGGSNAHVIVESVESVMGIVQSEVASREPDTTESPHLLAISAAHNESLEQRISQVQQYLLDNPDSLCDLAHTLGTKREHLRRRAFAVVTQTEVDGSIDFTKSDNASKKESRVVFAFPGQGVQWCGMGASLMGNFPSFREDMDRLDQALQGLPSPPNWRIVEKLVETGKDNDIDQPEISQPLCTAVQVGLVNLLKSWGIVPCKVIGHSSGEFAAAYAANATTFETAIVLAYYRGAVAEMAPKEGGMLAVAMSSDDIARYLDNDVVLACENSPNSVTLAGYRSQLEEVAACIRRDHEDVLLKLLPVERAYHSPHMALVGRTYENLIRPYLATTESTMIDLHSTVTGDIVTSPKDLSAAYWRRSLESPVMFSKAFMELAQSIEGKHQIVVEIASHPALKGPTRQILQSLKSSYTYCSTLKRHAVSVSDVFAVAGTLFLHQLPVNLLALNPAHTGKTLTNLPPYPWKHENTPWTESRLTKQWRLRKFPRHELLGVRCLESSDIEPAWRNILKGQEASWINEHRIQGLAVFPAVGYVAIASEAIRQITGSVDCTVRQVFLMEALIRDSEDVEIMTTLRKASLNATMESSWYEFSVCSYNGQSWTKHCIGQVKGGIDQPLPSSQISDPFSRHITSWRWYRRCEKKGLGYGPSFEGLRDITASPHRNAARGRVEDNRSLHGSYYAIHPTIVDQCLQVALVAGDKGVSHFPDKAGMPLYIDQAYIAPADGSMLIEAETTDPTEGSLTGTFLVVSESTGDVVLTMSGLRLLPIPNINSEGKAPSLATYLEWKPDICFLSPDVQVPSPIDVGTQVMENLSRAAFLILLDFVEVVRDHDTLPAYLGQYRRMILETGSKVARGEYDHIFGAREASCMTADERKKALETLISEVPDPRVRKFYHKAHEYATFHSSMFLDGSVFEDTSLLEPIHGIIQWSLGFFDWTTFLSPLSHSNQCLRILEIGAGAGSSTEVILNALTPKGGERHFSKFTVTDAVPSLLHTLKQRFDSVPRMEFSQLDISKDPGEQGFRPSSYDLIVVCNVLYETPVLRDSLTHIRSLLVPGGRLLLYEPCAEVPYLDTFMGILPGWWLGVGGDRDIKPYVTIDRWEEELRGSGFSGIDASAYNTPPPLHWQIVMLSTKPELETPRRPVTLLCTEVTRSHAWAQDVASRLADSGYEIHWRLIGEDIEKREDVIALLDLGTAFLDNITQASYDHLQHLMRSVKRILWVTHSIQMSCPDPRYSLVLGLARTLRGELNMDFGIFEIDSFDDTAASMILSVYERFAMPGSESTAREYEFILHQGAVHTGRVRITPITEHLHITDQHENYELDIQTPGDLSSIGWKPVKREEVGPHEVELKASYLSLNFKDLMMALGVVERTKTMDFCFEASGVITRVGSDVTDLKVGDRAGLFCPKPMSYYATVPAANIAIIPEECTLEDAAAVPSAYATAICTLMQIGQLQKGQTVLIHSACGAVGLAAINVCKHVGAEIFASVGSEEKAQFLVQNYGIRRSHIFDSHTDAFLSGVMQQTNGRGVDLVLNSLAGELLRASWKCVAKFGKLLEIGKRDILGHGALDLHGFQDCRSFCAFDLYTVAFDDPSRGRRALELGMELSENLENKLPSTLFEAQEVESAFRYMQKGQHVGKIVIKVQEDTSQLPLLQTPPEFTFSAKSAYLLVGGLRGIGVSIVRWMVELGARHFVFLSRSAGEGEEDRQFCRELDSQGCEAGIVAGSVADPAAVERAINLSSYPIAGVVQLSAVLKDGTFDKMTHDDWTSCLESKVQGTWNLHEKLLNQQLDFFIVFSSAVSFIGNPGQANYAAANSFLDGFVRYRRSLGLPASVVSLGPVDEMGLMAQKPDLMLKARQVFQHVMGEADVLKAFQLALLSAKDDMASDRPATVVTGLSPTLIANSPWMQQDAKFAAIVAQRSIGSTAGNNDREAKLMTQMASIQNNSSVLQDGTCEGWIIECLGEQLAMHGNAENMDPAEYGKFEVDSLASLHIKHWMRKKVDVDVSIKQIAEARTAEGIAKLVVAILRERYGVELEER